MSTKRMNVTFLVKEDGKGIPSIALEPSLVDEHGRHQLLMLELPHGSDIHRAHQIAADLNKNIKAILVYSY